MAETEGAVIPSRLARKCNPELRSSPQSTGPSDYRPAIPARVLTEYCRSAVALPDLRALAKCTLAASGTPRDVAISDQAAKLLIYITSVFMAVEGFGALNEQYLISSRMGPKLARDMMRFTSRPDTWINRLRASFGFSRLYERNLSFPDSDWSVFTDFISEKSYPSYSFKETYRLRERSIRECLLTHEIADAEQFIQLVYSDAGDERVVRKQDMATQDSEEMALLQKKIEDLEIQIAELRRERAKEKEAVSRIRKSVKRMNNSVEENIAQTDSVMVKWLSKLS